MDKLAHRAFYRVEPIQLLSEDINVSVISVERRDALWCFLFLYPQLLTGNVRVKCIFYLSVLWLS